MQPDAQTIAAGAPFDVDLSAGAARTADRRALARPSDLRRQPHARGAGDAARSRPASRNCAIPILSVLQQPPYAKNWHRSIDAQWAVFIGVCTHLGCIPLYEPNKNQQGPGWPGGCFCPCHGSKYDLAARVYKDVPAPYNLPVPPYRLVNAKTLRIGENPPGETFQRGLRHANVNVPHFQLRRRLVKLCATNQPNSPGRNQGAAGEE